LVFLPIHGIPTRDDDEYTDDDRGKFAPRFFIFTAKELGEIICGQHDTYKKKYRSKHGKEFEDEKGVYTVTHKQIDEYDAENAWHKIQMKFIEK
jgi:hypothetical protein